MAFFGTSICLRFVAWVSPLQKDDIILPGEDGTSLGRDLSWINAMWLLASTLVLRGCDLKISSASARTIAVIWWLFSLVVLIIYASLVSHWFDANFSSGGGQGSESIENLLKNPVLEFGVVHSGSTNFFLQNAKRENLQKIWWRVQKGAENRGFQPSISAGINEVVESHGRYAFITEEMNLNQALVSDCSLGMITGIDVRTFAVAVPKGSPLREKLSQAILQLGESGILHQIEEKWWPKPNCEEVEGGKPQVQLMNFAGPLTILIIGVVFAIFIAMIERVLHHRRSHRGFFRTATEPGNGKIAMNGCDSESN
ncbi:unnamed protein product [Orchesella dallaii]|uniref:Ionotropic glutamate receptor C-terminal domain-containing protein n=1 Tax=Orchesella dallaii TaxID=48710 RepID=A0ABP1Q933_9HEXA